MACMEFEMGKVSGVSQMALRGERCRFLLNPITDSEFLFDIKWFLVPWEISLPMAEGERR